MASKGDTQKKKRHEGTVLRCSTVGDDQQCSVKKKNIHFKICIYNFKKHTLFARLPKLLLPIPFASYRRLFIVPAKVFIVHYIICNIIVLEKKNVWVDVTFLFVIIATRPVLL